MLRNAKKQEWPPVVLLGKAGHQTAGSEHRFAIVTIIVVVVVVVVVVFMFLNES